METPGLFVRTRELIRIGGIHILHADKITQILSTRKLTDSQREELELLLNEIQEITGLCRVCKIYSAEAVGFPRPRPKPQKKLADDLFSTITAPFFLPKRPPPEPDGKSPSPYGTIHVYGRAITSVRKRWEEDKDDKRTLQEFFQKEATESEKKRAWDNIMSYMGRKRAMKHEIGFTKVPGGIKVIYIHGRTGEYPRSGTYMFVIDCAMSRLLIGKKSQGCGHHSSFLKSKMVACAGMLKIESEGRLMSFSLHSGHYLPSPEYAQVMYHYLACQVGEEESKKIVFGKYSK